MFGARELSYDNVFEKISPYDVFKYYIKDFEDVNVKFCSELRKDSTPTCSIFKTGDTLLYKDFGTGDCMNCVQYVQTRYNLTFFEALKVINSDFNLKLGGYATMPPTLNVVGVADKSIDINKIKERETYIQVQARDWNKNIDKSFWKDKYSITVKDLKKYNIIPLNYIWVNDNMINTDYITYGYFLGQIGDRELWKIYSPYSKTMKWISNVPKDVIQGARQLPEKGNKLYITSSLKDVIVLYKLGLNAIAPSSENTILPPDKIEEYKSRFGELVLFNDNDKPGIEASKTLSEVYGCTYIHIPIEYSQKDPSDFVKDYGYQKLKQVMGI